MAKCTVCGKETETECFTVFAEGRESESHSEFYCREHNPRLRKYKTNALAGDAARALADVMGADPLALALRLADGGLVELWAKAKDAESLLNHYGDYTELEAVLAKLAGKETP